MRALRQHSRWTLTALLTVTFASGGLLTASASVESGERSVFVPITPCRVMDTRPAPETVGARSTPLQPDETHTIAVHGTNGFCTIPEDATAIVMNVAVIEPSAASFLTVFPADAPRPLAANLNWLADDPPKSNAVTSDLSSDGRVAFYNLEGTVHVAADVVGYYVDHTHDDRYYTRAQVDAALATKTDVTEVRLHDDRYYTESEIDSVRAVLNDQLAQRALVSSVYTKSQADARYLPVRKIFTWSGARTEIFTATTGGSYVKLRELGTFTKAAGTVVRIDFVTSLTIQSTRDFCDIQVRVDGLNAAGNTFVDASTVYIQAEPGDRIPTTGWALFTGLAAGTHSVSLWVRAWNGTICTENFGGYPRQALLTESM